MCASNPDAARLTHGQSVSRRLARTQRRGRLLCGEAPLVEFAGIEDQLGKLLQEFGPSGSEKTRHNPFWHLRTDGVWQLEGPAGITERPAGATPMITELRRGRVAGGFAEPVRFALAPTTLRSCDGWSARGRASYARTKSSWRTTPPR